MFDFIRETEFNLTENFFRSLVYIIIYVFFDWAWKPKDYNKE